MQPDLIEQILTAISGGGAIVILTILFAIAFEKVEELMG